MQKLRVWLLALLVALLWMPATAHAHGGYEGLFLILALVGVASLLGVVIEILQLVWIIKCFKGTASARVIKWCRGLGIFQWVLMVICFGMAYLGKNSVDAIRIFGLWGVSFAVMGSLGVYAAKKASHPAP